MGSRMGFEYRYRFRVDDDIIPHFNAYIILFRNVLFEIRTNFIVKGELDDGVIIDSESFGVAIIGPGACFDKHMKFWTDRRLKDYWMSDDEIHDLVCKALAFAEQSAPNPQHGGLIAVVVDIDVCTVQQEGEPINATMDRAVRTQCLYPMNLCPMDLASPWKNRFRLHANFELLMFLRDKLHTIRVEDVEKSSSLMEVCRICSRRPTVGAQISLLQCGHAFHTYCVVPLLEKSNSCPVCRQQAYSYKPKKTITRNTVRRKQLMKDYWFRLGVLIALYGIGTISCFWWSESPATARMLFLHAGISGLLFGSCISGLLFR